MKKKTRRIFSIMLIIAMCFACTTTAFADSSSNNGTSKKEVVQLTMENPTVFVSEDGEQTITLDLMEKDPKTRAVVIVGKAKFRVIWEWSRYEFEGQWSITLTNKDKVKKVTGKMLVRKDLLGPYNPILAEMSVNQKYNIGTLFANAEGVTHGGYSTADASNLNYDTNIILQWRDFLVDGVEKDYFVRDGERQGKINGLDRYPN
jgi:hypothetical protein